MSSIDPSAAGKKGGEARAKRLSGKERRAIAQTGATKRWHKDLPQATHPGEINLGGLVLACAVLSDGRRVISERGLLSALDIKVGGTLAKQRRQDGAADLPMYVGYLVLKPFIDNDLMALLTSPIAYIPTHGGQPAHGVLAEVIPRILDVWLRARDDSRLTTERLREIAARADVLMRGLAQVGIIALVDEATGYQDERERNALAKILESFVAKELQPWVKTFPIQYYREIYRLRGWPWPPKKSNTHNSNLGKYTNDLVYDRLAPGVCEELHRITPRDEKGRLVHKLHQRLTHELGHPKLREHIGSVVMALQMSKSWNGFMEAINEFLPRFPKVGETSLLPFSEPRRFCDIVKPSSAQDDEVTGHSA